MSTPETKSALEEMPPYLVSLESDTDPAHLYVVLPISRGGGYGPTVYGLAEPQHLDPQTDGEVNMDIYDLDDLKAEIAKGVYRAAWSWDEINRLCEAGVK